ncbi:hypothetical protein [Citrobacter gillenii]|jgi:hypothetical protein|uniref:Uncharacterized protein n=2 Tax=Citrobacter freundii complex TaxID=1344959 RepID=A0ABD6M4F0_9ENTR|nr:hypothetical protein [Citrobacter gillenii]NTZ51099.1 hypothetical protein [Citrobacter gillenii]
MIKPDLQIAFITGRSRADNCSLSPAQATFIQQVVGHHQHVDVNFPWTVQSVPWLATGLLRASVNNAREYLGAQHVSFALRYRQQALEMLASASHTLLLSGSCGLELFNQLHLLPEWLARVSVFAFGPVAGRRPDCHHLLVQGDQDCISRCWFRQADQRIACSHMNYLEQPQLAALCRRFIADTGKQGA